LLVKDRMPVREGAELREASGRAVGRVTSGGFGPTLGAPVAMAYVDHGCVAPGAALHAVARGREVPVEVVKMPFVPQRYYRG
jgi:aminomethyltransferase